MKDREQSFECKRIPHVVAVTADWLLMSTGNLRTLSHNVNLYIGHLTQAITLQQPNRLHELFLNGAYGKHTSRQIIHAAYDDNETILITGPIFSYLL